ncbi:MAG: hypothetical protein AAF288_00510 [Planctomycetota bacterium]
MVYDVQIAQALVRCEAQLQKIAAEAMSSGDYPAARAGLELAELLAARRNSLEPRSPTASATDQHSVKSTPLGPANGPLRSKTTTRKTAAERTRKASVGSRSYPKFARQGDKLIKIGWSKRLRQEYTHKAPWPAIRALAERILERTRDGQRFTIDDLVPVPDPVNDGQLPAYQVYLGVAWLRDLGVLHKHGRDGYSVEHASISDKALSQAWDRLPSSKA